VLNWKPKLSWLGWLCVCVALNVKSANNENKVVLSTRRQMQSSVCPDTTRMLPNLLSVCAFEMESIILLCDLLLPSMRFDSISKVNRQRRRRVVDKVKGEPWYASHLPAHMICRPNPLILHRMSWYPCILVWGWTTLAGQTPRQSRHSPLQVVRASLMEIQLN